MDFFLKISIGSLGTANLPASSVGEMSLRVFFIQVFLSGHIDRLSSSGLLSKIFFQIFVERIAARTSRTKHLFLYLWWAIFFLEGIRIEYLFWSLIANALLPNLVEDFAYFFLWGVF